MLFPTERADGWLLVWRWVASSIPPSRVKRAHHLPTEPKKPGNGNTDDQIDAKNEITHPPCARQAQKSNGEGYPTEHQGAESRRVRCRRPPRDFQPTARPAIIGIDPVARRLSRNASFHIIPHPYRTASTFALPTAHKAAIQTGLFSGVPNPRPPKKCNQRRATGHSFVLTSEQRRCFKCAEKV
jgi:hypothetical protein